MIQAQVVAPDRVGIVFVCDVCHEQITDAGLGMVKYSPEVHSRELGEGGAVAVLHKGACDQVTDPKGSPHQYWGELGDVIVQLWLNSHMHIDDTDGMIEAFRERLEYMGWISEEEDDG